MPMAASTLSKPAAAASPTRLALYSAPALRVPADRRFPRQPETGPVKRACSCSPTTHPGSFRCSLHKGGATGAVGGGRSHRGVSTRLNARRSATTNSLVRIGTVEGEWLKRALAALIRPSSHHQRRTSAFRPRPSRLSLMSKAGD